MAEITSNPGGNPRVQDTTEGRTSGTVSSPKPAEFERFEKLTEKLTQVPKSELDEKRQTG